jgi:hypothetical protein
MPDYRFFRIGLDGHVAGPPSEHMLPDDAAALEKAQKLSGGNDIEIWQAERLVAYIVPDQYSKTG